MKRIFWIFYAWNISGNSKIVQNYEVEINKFRQLALEVRFDIRPLPGTTKK
tara:strand:- start:1205 stop:1357 length:153 start_codon:yes stop_codon:yes gene_type:complete